MVPFEGVELEDEGAPVNEPLVGGTTVVAAQPEHVLIPPAGYLDIAYGDERLGLGVAANSDGYADAVTCGVIALDQVALTAIRLGPTCPPPPLASMRWRTGPSWSARIHTPGPESPADGRSMVHSPMIPGASRRPPSRSTDQPKTAR